jgi:hypothetical protein
MRNMPIEQYEQILLSMCDILENGGVARSPSVVFKAVDPLMYEMGLAEWLDELQTEGNWCDTCECFIGDYSHANGPFMSACYCEEEEE